MSGELPKQGIFKNNIYMGRIEVANSINNANNNQGNAVQPVYWNLQVSFHHKPATQYN